LVPISKNYRRPFSVTGELIMLPDVRYLAVVSTGRRNTLS